MAFYHILQLSSNQQFIPSACALEGQILVKNPNVKPIAAEVSRGRIRYLGVISEEHEINKVRAWADELGKRLTG